MKFKVLSNIHTIRAKVVGKDERTWLFDDEYSDSVSIMDYSECFIRALLGANESQLGILFELSVYCRKKNTNEESELCCGWAHIPFVDHVSNTQIVNKSYDLLINGGSIYDKNVPLDPDLARNRACRVSSF